MSIGLIRETINLKKELLAKDKEYTNELLVDDIISYLGYNKRLDTGVNRRVSEDIDWEIQKEDSDDKMMVKVYSYGFNPDNGEIARVASVAKEHNYKICLITDGENIIILRPFNVLYGSIKINLFNENDKTKEILDALSKNNTDPSVVDYYYYKELMTSEVIEETVRGMEKNIAVNVLNELGCPEKDEFISEVIKAVSKVYDKSIHDSETLELQNNIKNKELELAGAKESIEILTSKLEVTQKELKDKQEELESQAKEIENRDNEIAGYINSLEELKSLNGQIQGEFDAYKEQAESETEAGSTDKNAESEVVDVDEQLKLENDALNKENKALTDVIEELKKESNELKTSKGALESEIELLKKEIENLNKVIEGLKASNESITLSRDVAPIIKDDAVSLSLEDENIKSLAAEITEKLRVSQGDDNVEELNKLQYYIYNLELSLSNTKRMLEELNKEKSDLETENDRLNQKIVDLDISLKETLKKYEDLLQKFNELKTENEELSSQNSDLSKFLEQSRQRNEELLANGVSSGNNEGTDAIMANYRLQIEELSTKLANAEEKVEDKQKECDELQRQLDELAGSKDRRVREILGAMVDSSDANRSYVSVIDEVIQESTSLQSFIGLNLQKLYDLKGFEAANYIFNGDMFKLIPNGERRDLLINTKPYDIDVTDLSEDEALNKLRVIYSKFSDIPFGCKKIGVKKETDEPVEITENTGDEIDGSEYLEDGQYQNGECADDLGNYEQEPMDGEYLGYYDNQGYESTEYNQEAGGYSDDYQEEPVEDNYNMLFVTPLNHYNTLLSREDFQAESVRYLLSETNTYMISLDGEEINYDRQLAKCIDALLVLAMKQGYYDIVKQFKSLSLNDLNVFQFMTPENTATEHVKASVSQYIISGVDSVYTVAEITCELASRLGINADGMWMYFDGYTDSEEVNQMYGDFENRLAIHDTLLYQPTEDGSYNRGLAVVPGYLPDAVPLTINSLIAHNDILKDVVAVKTEKIGVAIRAEEDYIKVIKAMFENSGIEPKDIDTNKLGTIINDPYNKFIVYDNENELEGTGYGAFEYGDKKFFVPDMEVYQYIYSLITLQANLMHNKKIAVKVGINLDALDFYSRNFDSSEPSLVIAVNEFTSLISKDK